MSGLVLLNVVVQICESLYLLQVFYGNRDFIGELHQGDEIHQVDAVEVKRFFQVRIRRELAFLDFKLLSQQAVYLCDDFFSCFHYLYVFDN